jgi:hypothetical protein
MKLCDSHSHGFLGAMNLIRRKVIIDKSRYDVSLLEQDAIENVS